tara:strand:+ start:321 stop:488 length:168 start_codon:yes stop_codon:yes gene_type:complete
VQVEAEVVLSTPQQEQVVLVEVEQVLKIGLTLQQVLLIQVLVVEELEEQMVQERL